MQIEYRPNRDPDGFVCIYRDGAFRTHRYILPQRDMFVTVNPFGSTEDCPCFATLDEAKEYLEKEVDQSRS